ncbi:MAG: gamma-glutamyl-gamma-aminobutyrate hydrolase family protein [Treponema sp.]|jgi:putative glutamine amidotransferase|nr:gamma-glutamyl-gamma-aminobutyrate hydrolase family protein [Treponema sp.]
MMAPIVLLNGGPAYDRKFESKSFVLNKTYAVALVAAGAVPIMPLEEDLIDEYAELADGLVLSGAQSYTPRPDLAEDIETTGSSFRDRFDEKLYRAFYKLKKPILGICLGFQEINIFQGGDLENNFKFKEGKEHMMIPHAIKTEKGSVLNNLFGDSFIINSRHNRRINKLGAELKITATADDGRVIEAIEHESLPIIAFEWHPERMRSELPEAPEGPDMTPLFMYFVDLAKKAAAARKR